MKTNRMDSPQRTRLRLLGLLSSLVLSASVPAGAESPPFGVPVRLSFKFILDADGYRPSVGPINTPEEIALQVANGNWTLRLNQSELRLHEIEVLDVSDASQFYEAGFDDVYTLKTTAQLAASHYHWRSDAINIYITANTNDSAVSYLPPFNNFIMMCQSIWDTTLIHEVGHSLNLHHTHEGQTAGCTIRPCGVDCFPGNDDLCSDTLPDAECWYANDIALFSFDEIYVGLNAEQKQQVDVTWWNVMSYHSHDDRSLLTPCQLNRMSAQAYEDRNWLLSKIPVYVDADGTGTASGTFVYPYHTIQEAMSAGALSNRVLVLKTGTHEQPPNPMRAPTDMVTRSGPSVVRDARMPYSLPVRLEASKNKAVREAMVRAQQADRQKDLAGVIRNLLVAEQAATGREKDSIRMELAQRYRDSQRPDEAALWFQKIATDADQPALRQRAATKAARMEKEAEQRRLARPIRDVGTQKK